MTNANVTPREYLKSVLESEYGYSAEQAGEIVENIDDRRVNFAVASHLLKIDAERS